MSVSAQLSSCSRNATPRFLLMHAADESTYENQPSELHALWQAELNANTGDSSAVIDIMNVSNNGGSTPSVATLNNYDAVIVVRNRVGTNTYADASTLGSNIDTYVDNGGSLLLTPYASCAAFSGALAGSFNLFLTSDTAGSDTGEGSASLTNVVFTHPVFSGIASSSSHVMSSNQVIVVGGALTDIAGTTVLATYSSGRRFVYEKGRVLELNFIPTRGATSVESQFLTLVSNSLLYLCDKNTIDQCPSDPNKTEPGQCGCGVADTDSDSDGVADCNDNCPNDANPQQEDDDSDGLGNVCSCPLEDTSCNYQPDPPVVTFSDVVIGDDDLAYYRIQMNASRHWSEYVKVLFPESDNEHCDYPSGVVVWDVTTASDDPCTKQYSVDIAVSDFLGKCGFSQTIRNGDSMFFQQTAQILTNRTCEDGRINQLSLSDVELSATRSVSRETQYEIEIVAPTNATAKTGGLEVFGTAFKLELLGDLTITPDIDTNMPTISGFFVTETQHPYELQDPVFELTGDFNYATFELTGTYCTADNSTRLPCQQTWSYSFQPNQTCPDKAQLEGELVQVTWNVNCSDGFIGECAPSFAVQPEATFTLNSPIYCFSSDYIELTPALEVYQFDQLTANSADFGASNLGTLTDNGFSVERVFTIDSQLYAEYTVVAAGTGVTLTATTLKKVSTTTSSRGELVLYETNAAEQVITQATTFVVHDTGFGTGESSDFADYRTRFEFTWLNDTTVLLDSTEDLAQTIALSATAISIFTNVQSLRDAGIDERHPVLSKLNAERFSKEQEDKHMILFADGDEPRDSKTTVLARLAPASTTNTPAASTASSGFVVSPTVAAAGIALIAVVALVAFAVIRRGSDNASKAPAVQHQLPASSSGVQLADFAMPIDTSGSTLSGAFTLDNVAQMYSTNTTASTTAAPMQY
jgi:hypothetical protein